MAGITIKGDTSGEITLNVPATAGTNTITIPASSGTMTLEDGSGDLAVTNDITAGGTITASIFSGDASSLTNIPAANLTGTLPAGTNVISSGTSVSASGTSVDFTSIPSWVKRITVMLNGVSTNGASNLQIQIGAGSITTSGYLSGSTESGTIRVAYTTGFGLNSASSQNLIYTQMIITNVSGNIWLASFAGNFSQAGIYYSLVGGGNVTLSGTLDRIRITTVNGTDTFDAGSINILYE